MPWPGQCDGRARAREHTGMCIISRTPTLTVKHVPLVAIGLAVLAAAHVLFAPNHDPRWLDAQEQALGNRHADKAAVQRRREIDEDRRAHKRFTDAVAEGCNATSSCVDDWVRSCDEQQPPAWCFNGRSCTYCIGDCCPDDPSRLLYSAGPAFGLTLVCIQLFTPVLASIMVMMNVLELHVSITW